MNQSGLPDNKPVPRVLSIDALRGFDMFWIMGGDSLVKTLLGLSALGVAPALQEQLTHVEWEGFRFYDLIFPLFLFLVGCVLPYSLEKYRESPSQVYLRIVRRVLMLVGLGLVCNRILQFHWDELRVAGVLQRIGICYGVAAIIYLHLRLRSQAMLFLLIVLGYWAILAWIPVPGGATGDYSPAGNLAGYIDRGYLPGKIKPEYYGFGDNEGLLSTLPAIATVLLGVFAGQLLKSGYREWTKVAALILAGCACVLLGHFWGQRFPIVKNLWTSSFVFVSGGYSLMLLGVFYAAVDVLKFQRAAFFWIVIGANAIAIFIIPRFIDFKFAASFFFGGLAEHSGQYSTLVLQSGKFLLCWLLLWWLYRNKIFLRV